MNSPAVVRDPQHDESSLVQYLRALRPLLDDPQVTELCINRPGEAWIERYSGWALERLGFCTFAWCRAVAKAAATYTNQSLTESRPVLSAMLPSGERIQIVIPPVTPEGCVSITIRKPSTVLWSLDQLASAEPVTTFLPDGSQVSLTLDVFCETQTYPDPLPNGAPCGDLRRRDFVTFLRHAVLSRKNILLSGATGSGKTTIAKALLLEIPADDRIITIEDVRELVLANQPNSVSLLYSHGAQGQAKVTGDDLLASAKRMRPDRIIVSELRTGDEAYDYLTSINTGHPGSITSIHADSAEGAFVALAQLMRRSEAGRGMSIREGVELAQMNVDVVVQCARIKQHRFVSEIWYDPSTKRLA